MVIDGMLHTCPSLCQQCIAMVVHHWWRKGLVMSRLGVLPVLPVLISSDRSSCSGSDAPITIRGVTMFYAKHYYMVIDQCNKQKQQSNKQSSDEIEKELRVVLNQN